MRIGLYGLTVLLLVLSGAAVGSAEEGPTDIRADNLEYRKQEGLYLLKGGVRIQKDDSLLTADEAEYYAETGRAVLRGNVTYEDASAVITADSADINVNGKTGRLENAALFLREDGYRIWARAIEKTAENRYTLESARFTTCETPVSAWCFSTSAADVIVGDRLKAKDVAFRVRDFPILYTPYLWAPVATERKTGLLTPRFGYRSRDGAFYGQPFFIVISDNRDATVTLDYSAKKGFGEGLQYRYVERGGIAGTWDFYHARDDQLDKDFLVLNAQHSQYRQEGLSHFLNLNLVNDRDFFQEYSISAERRVQRYAESTAGLSYLSGPVRLFTSGQYWHDLQEDSDKVLNYLPRVGATLYPVGVGPVLFSLGADAKNFYSVDSYRAQRYSVSPALSATVGDSVRLEQKVGLTQSFYRVAHTDAYPDESERLLFSYSGVAQAALFRRYGRITHSFTPEIGYDYATDTSYDAPVLDSYELLGERSDVFLALSNDLIGRHGLVFSSRVVQPYDLLDADEPWKRLHADFALRTRLSMRFAIAYDHYVKGITNWDGEVGTSFRAIQASLGQRYDRENRTLFYTGGLNVQLSRKVALSNTIWYDARGGGLRDLSSSLTYTSQCWGVTVTYVKQPGDYSILFGFELKGLGGFGS